MIYISNVIDAMQEALKTDKAYNERRDRLEADGRGMEYDDPACEDIREAEAKLAEVLNSYIDQRIRTALDRMKG